MQDSIYPLVSIVIPTRDSDTEFNLYLKMTLEGITLQTYPNIETIIVCEGLERSQQLNIGIQRSHGKYIFRCDDDWLLQPETISESVHLIESKSCDFVCINNIFLKSKSLLKEVRRIERDIITSNKSGYNLHIAGNFFLKSDLPQTPFNESLYAGEEYHLHDSLVSKGFRFKVAQSYCLHLRETSSWSKLLAESIYYGKNLNTYLSTNPNKVRMSVLRRYYLQSLDHFNSPKLLCGFILFKFLQYFGALIGMLSGESK